MEDVWLPPNSRIRHLKSAWTSKLLALFQPRCTYLQQWHKRIVHHFSGCAVASVRFLGHRHRTNFVWVCGKALQVSSFYHSSYWFLKIKKRHNLQDLRGCTF